MTERSPIGPGERAPDFVLPGADGSPRRFYGFVGGAPTVLVIEGGDGPAGPLGDRLAATTDAAVHLVTRDGVAADPVVTYVDAEGGLRRGLGLEPDGPAAVLVLDPNVRVAARIEPDGGDRDVAAVAAAVERVRHRGPEGLAARQAPVLLVPDVLDQGWRGRLMTVWEKEGAVATGVETSAGGERSERTDELRKRRRDHVVADRQLLRQLTSHLGRRILPEVEKAFAYEARGFEGFKIGCYDATDQGFFEAHRDNLSSATAHRRFALTLNLNDAYEGGELSFPEYGPQLYRPEAGEALVFSGSHLHEVRPVTAGRRFVLLSFLLDRRAGDRRPPAG